MSKLIFPPFFRRRAPLFDIWENRPIKIEWVIPGKTGPTFQKLDFQSLHYVLFLALSQH
jgi:hypothetical protein